MWDLLNFFVEGLIEGLFALFLGLERLVLTTNVFVVQFVGEQLNGMIVMGNEFIVTVDLVCKSAFLTDKRLTAPSLMSSTGVSA